MKTFADKAKGIFIMKKVQEGGDLSRANTMKMKALIRSALPGIHVRNEDDLPIKQDYRTYLKRPEKVRIEQKITDANGKESFQIIISTGDKTYVKTPDNPGGAVMEKEEGALIASGAITAISPPTISEDEAYVFIGEENIDGQACDIVQMLDRRGHVEAKLWIDREMHTVIQMETGHSEGIIRVRNSDFEEEIYGGWMPRKAETYHNGVLISVMRVKTLEFDRHIDDSLFSQDSLMAKD